MLIRARSVGTRVSRHVRQDLCRPPKRALRFAPQAHVAQLVSDHCLPFALAEDIEDVAVQNEVSLAR